VHQAFIEARRAATRLAASATGSHLFRAADRLPSARFGEDLDIVLRHRVRAPLAIEAAGSYVWAGPAFAQVRWLRRKLLFGYAMATLTC
jgi:hypothetical protein